MSFADEATPAPTVPSFQDLLDKAKTTLQGMTNHVNQMLGLPENANSEQVFNTMKEETDKLRDRVKTFAENLQKEVSSANTRLTHKHDDKCH